MKSRKANRLKGYDYSRDNLYFVTNCVKDRLCCLGSVEEYMEGSGRDLTVPPYIPKSDFPEIGVAKSNYPEVDHSASKIHHFDNDNKINFCMVLSQYGHIVNDRIEWLSSQYEYVIIHNYVVMPNHIHLIIEIDSLKVKEKDVKIKSLSSLMGALKTTSSKLIHQAGFIDFAWHRSFHDHIIRNEKSLHNISNYIDQNPQKWHKDTFYETR